MVLRTKLTVCLKIGNKILIWFCNIYKYVYPFLRTNAVKVAEERHCLKI